MQYTIVMTTKITALTRYPVKGLSGQQLDNVQLLPNQGFPSDRQFGFARPDSGFNPEFPKPLPKTKFYMLARDARLALLNTNYEENTGILTISSPGSTGMFQISTTEGKAQANQFLGQYLELPDDEMPELFEASPHRFTDVSVVSKEMMNAVSLINIDSVQAFEAAINHPISPERFRGNIQLTGLSPFSELELVGEEITIGAVRLKVVLRTKRCPATEVDLNTAIRDVNVPDLLQKHYGHKDMGIYAEVLEGGVISTGDSVSL